MQDDQDVDHDQLNSQPGHSGTCTTKHHAILKGQMSRGVDPLGQATTVTWGATARDRRLHEMTASGSSPGTRAQWRFCPRGCVAGPRVDVGRMGQDSPRAGLWLNAAESPVPATELPNCPCLSCRGNYEIAVFKPEREALSVTKIILFLQGTWIVEPLTFRPSIFQIWLTWWGVI